MLQGQSVRMSVYTAPFQQSSPRHLLWVSRVKKPCCMSGCNNST